MCPPVHVCVSWLFSVQLSEECDVLKATSIADKVKLGQLQSQTAEKHDGEVWVCQWECSLTVRCGCVRGCVV